MSNLHFFAFVPNFNFSPHILVKLWEIVLKRNFVEYYFLNVLLLNQKFISSCMFDIYLQSIALKVPLLDDKTIPHDTETSIDEKQRNVV